MPVWSTFKSLLTPNTTETGPCGVKSPSTPEEGRKKGSEAMRLYDDNSDGSRRGGMKDGREEGSHCDSGHSAHLLVCQPRAALKWGQVAVEQGSARPVMFTEDCTIDVMEAIPRH